MRSQAANILLVLASSPDSVDLTRATKTNVNIYPLEYKDGHVTADNSDLSFTWFLIGALKQ